MTPQMRADQMLAAWQLQRQRRCARSSGVTAVAMKAEFSGRIYLHPMIAERQREVAVSITALQMMQAHHDNPYFCFRCVSDIEERTWHRIADLLVPAVHMISERSERL